MKQDGHQGDAIKCKLTFFDVKMLFHEVFSPNTLCQLLPKIKNLTFLKSSWTQGVNVTYKRFSRCFGHFLKILCNFDFCLLPKWYCNKTWQKVLVLDFRYSGREAEFVNLSIFEDNVLLIQKPVNEFILQIF